MKLLKQNSLPFEKRSYNKIVFVLIGTTFLTWIGSTQIQQQKLVQYPIIQNMLSSKKAEAAVKEGFKLTAKSPFVTKVPSVLANNSSQKSATTIPVASIPKVNAQIPQIKPLELMAVIYGEDGNNIAIVTDNGYQRTIKVNDDTTSGVVSQIGEKHIVVGGISIPLTKK